MSCVLFQCHNRLLYNQITLPAVVRECQNSTTFEHLYVLDDNSTDGTFEFVESLDLCSKLNNRCSIIRKHIGHSVYGINLLMKIKSIKRLIKIDNDILIPDGCFDILNSFINHYAIVGLVNKEFNPNINMRQLKLERAPHVGGVGIFDLDIFRKYGPIPSFNRFHGFTHYQSITLKHHNIGWLTGMNATNLDWSFYSMKDIYISKGWSR